MKNALLNSRIIFVIIVTLAINSFTHAQNQNGLDFDGANDQVLVTAGSSRIANSSQISMTLWVYPTNPAPSFPNFDGFAGLRNNADADFYLLHYTANSIEARFRNSAGINYDIISSGLVLNAWQHYAFTYDGTKLRIYRNGVVKDSIAASGTITNTTENFYLGNLIYQTTNYYLDGKLDEVSLWSHALSPSEVSCIYRTSIDTGSTGLQLYYRCNQGTAGGINTGLTTLTDGKSHINGILQNFNLTGASSNWVAGASNYTALVATICPGQSYFFQGQILTTSGVYTAAVSTTAICDSILQLTLTVTDTSFTQNGNILHANQNGATYQWVDCNNGFAPIAGATTQNYTPASVGNYAVIVTLNNCSDTSFCHTYTPASINENDISSFIHAYPNPVDSRIYIDFEKPFQNLTVIMMDITGKEIVRETYSSKQKLDLDISSFAPGVYIMQFTTEGGSARLRLVKQ